MFSSTEELSSYLNSFIDKERLGMESQQQRNMITAKQEQARKVAEAKQQALNAPIPKTPNEVYSQYPDTTPEEFDQWKQMRDLQIQAELEQQQYNQAFKRPMSPGRVLADAGLSIVEGAAKDVPQALYEAVNVASTVPGIAVNKLRSLLGMEEVNIGGLDQALDTIGLAPKFNSVSELLDKARSQESLDTRQQMAVTKAQEDYKDQLETQAAIAAGANPYLAKGKEIGKQFLRGITDLADNPTEGLNSVVQSLPQLLAAGAVGKLATSGLDVSTAAGQLVAKRMAASAAVAYTGVSEGGSNAGQVREEINNLSKEDLEAIPGFKELSAKVGFETAKQQTAQRVANETMVYAGILGALTSKFSKAGDLEGNLFTHLNVAGSIKEGIKSFVKNMAEEGGEELVQGATGQLSVNLAKQNNINPNQQLTDDVGYQAGAGMFTGVLSVPASKVIPKGRDKPVAAAETPKTVEDIDVVSTTYRTQLEDLDKDYIGKTRDDITEDMPVLAKVSILLNANQIPEDKEAHYQELKVEHDKLQTAVVEAQQKAMEASPQEAEALRDAAIKMNTEREYVYDKILTFRQSFKEDNPVTVKEVDAIDSPEKATEVYTRILNSEGDSDTEVSLDVYDKALKNPYLTPEQVKVITEAKELKEVQEEISAKNVNSSIINGSKGFFGVNQYKKAITDYISNGDKESASSMLTALNKWAANHEVKADRYVGKLKNTIKDEAALIRSTSNYLTNRFTETFSETITPTVVAPEVVKNIEATVQAEQTKEEEADNRVIGEAKSLVEQRNKEIRSFSKLSEADKVKAFPTYFRNIQDTNKKLKAIESTNTPELNTKIKESLPERVVDTYSSSRLDSMVKVYEQAKGDPKRLAALDKRLEAIGFKDLVKSRVKEAPVEPFKAPEVVGYSDATKFIELKRSGDKEAFKEARQVHLDNGTWDQVKALTKEIEQKAEIVRKHKRNPRGKADYERVIKQAKREGSYNAIAAYLQGSRETLETELSDQRVTESIDNRLAVLEESVDKDAMSKEERQKYDNAEGIAKLKILSEVAVKQGIEAKPVKATDIKMEVSENAAIFFNKGLKDVVNLKVDKNSLLQTTPNLFTSNNYELLYSQLSTGQQQTLSVFKEFHDKLFPVIKNTIQKNKSNNITKSPVGYLLSTDGEVADNVVSALIIAGYSWLAQDGVSSLYNTDEGIKRTFGLDKNDVVPHHLFNILSPAGKLYSSTRETMAKEAMNLLGLTKRTDRQMNNYEGLVTTLGAVIVDAMEVTNYLTRTEVPNKVIAELTGNPSKNPKAYTTFIKVVPHKKDNTEPADHVSDHIETAKAGHSLFHDVFGTSKYVVFPVFEKPETITESGITGSIQKAGKEYVAGLNAMQSMPFRLDTERLSLFKSLPKEVQESMVGILSEEELQQVPDKDLIKARGRNQSYRYELQNLDQFLELIDSQEQGRETPFYLTADIKKNDRLMYDSNTFNPVASKIHRWLGQLQDMEVTIDPKNKEDMTQFMLAVGLGLGVSIDSNNLQKSLDETAEILNKPEIKEAIRAMKNKPNKETASKILAGVKAGKEKLHTFAALQAYSKMTKTEPFKTTLFIEIDGKTNGPAIGLLQYYGASGEQFAPMAARVGLFTEETGYTQYSDFTDDPGNLDSYQDMAAVTAYMLPKPTKHPKSIAVHALGVSFYQDGKITKEARKLHKPPVMTNIYGIGMRKLVDNYLFGLIDQMLDATINALQTDPDGLGKERITHLNTLLSRKINFEAIKKNPLSLNLEGTAYEEVRKEFYFVYGVALKAAIEESYGVFLTNRDIISNSINLGFEVYSRIFENAKNKAIRDKKDKLIAELGDKPKPEDVRFINQNTDLTFDEFRELRESLREYAPIVATPFSTSLEDDVSLLKEGDKARQVDNYLYRFELNTTHTRSVKLMASAPYFEAPGASVGPLLVLSFDSAVISKLLAKHNVINMFDAAGIPLNKVSEVHKDFNEIFKELNLQYNMRAKVQDTLERMYRGMGLLTANQQVAVNKLVAKKFEETTGYATLGHMTEGYREALEDVTRFRERHLASIKHWQQFPHPRTKPEGKEFNSVSGSSIKATQFRTVVPKEVREGNAVATFDTLTSLGLVKDGTDHTVHLRNIVSGFSKVIANPIKLYLQVRGKRTEGMTDLQNIYINQGTHKASDIEMSVGETYVHELVHTVVGHGLDHRPQLRAEVKRLFDYTEKVLAARAAKKGVPVHELFYTEGMSKADKAVVKARYDYIFNNSSKRAETSKILGTEIKDTQFANNYLHEFLTYGITNKVIMDVLSSIPINEKLPVTVVDKLSAVFNKVLNWVLGDVVKITEPNVQKRLETLAHALSQVQIHHESIIEKGLNKADGVIKETVDAYVVTPLIKTGNSKLTGPLGVVNWDRVDPVQFKQNVYRLLRKYGLKQEGIVLNTLQQILPSEGMLQKTHDLLRISLNRVDQLRQTVTTQIAKNIINSFTDRLTNETKSLMSQIIVRADLPVLKEQGYTPEQIQQLLSSNTVLQNEIVNTQNAILNGGFGVANANFYINHSFNLAHMMLHHTSTMAGAMHNPYAIARMVSLNGVTQQHSYAPTGDLRKAEQLIDRLSTLAALKAIPEADRKQFVDLWNNEPDGVIYSILMADTFKKDSQKILFKDNKMQMRKGYIKEDYSPYVEFTVANASEEAELFKQGFVKRGKVSFDNLYGQLNTADTYIFTKNTGQTSRVRGAIALDSKKHKGTDIGTVALQQNLQTPNGPLFSPDIQKAILDQFNNKPVRVDTNHLLPIYDEKGKVANMAYSMSVSLKEEYLGMQDNFDKAMGRMYASLQTKPNTTQINDEIAKALYEDFRDNYNKYQADFKLLAKDSADYNRIPYEMRQKLNKLFKGHKTIPVRHEAYVSLFGYREWSITDLQDSKSAAGKAYRAVLHTLGIFSNGKINPAFIQKVESVWKELVGVAKDFIVIRSVDVLIGNVISNVLLCWSKGMPLSELIRLHAEGYKYIHKYQDDTEKLQLLSIQAKLRPNDRGLKVQISRLQEELLRNPVQELIRAGVFQSIMEDLDVLDLPEEYPSQLENFFKPIKDKLPNGIKTAADVLFIGKHTQVYNFLRDTTQVSDFTSRYALHQYNMRRKNKTKEESLTEIVDTFINYDIPSHQGIDYANKMGIVLFTKYWLRVQKIIYNLTHEKPSRVLLLGLGDQIFNYSDIYDSSFIQQGVFSHFQSPGLILGAPTQALPVALINDLVF